MMEYINFNRTIITLLCVYSLLSCVSIEETLELEATPQDYSEIIPLRVKPTGMGELEYECACMDNEINSIKTFTDKMNKSKFAVLYQALGREKISVINDHKNTIECQQFDGTPRKKDSPQDYSETTNLSANQADIDKLESECHRMDDEIKKLSSFANEMSKSKFAIHYKELGQDMILTIKNHKNAIDCQQFN